MTTTAETLRTEITQMRADVAKNIATFELTDDDRKKYADILDQVDEIERQLESVK